MITEHAIFPQFVTDASHGKLGQRMWQLDPCEDMQKFLSKVSKSHWRNWEGKYDHNTVPVRIDCGPLDDKLIVEHKTTDDPHYDIDVPALKCGQMKVIAQYQFLLITTCWPIKKPQHPKDSVLSLDVKGSGQFLTVNPMALRGGGGPQAAFDPSMMNRIIIPITEYRITCERMTLEQAKRVVNQTPTRQSWKNMEGCVNDDEFLGEKPGTLVFDTWSLNEMFACDPDDPVRWRLTANLRCRQVWDKEGKLPHNVPPYPAGPSAGGGHKEALGWNWDYHTDGATGGWKYIQMLEESSPTGLTPRYPYRKFEKLFCEDHCETDCGPGDGGGSDSGEGGSASNGGGGSSGGSMSGADIQAIDIGSSSNAR